ncbi:GNAT family N-acetyltransferase [Lysinibacillus sphaericus]|uniref:Acetyltransferase n=2 Tax=Lysinibacillus TaxID=400634 RepID=W7RNS9_LYSSH|nr:MULTISPECIES: GNAT family N-acetyltransferase [Lysinibacillus]MBE5083226.1 GNAT family N-acetyltransferase [Bacillus thuringiensis]AMO33725.1 acetyltransferase [Lysinibacillus sphaericus]AMR91166.1 acetyltransferase [Lysinibacillus sphaericus]ANA45215.1 acetyltransferase [Lysinibacillus sphaericus]EWH32254.1 acetyltransferase [Lysinibacillus sphaericus CBAM5]
MSDIKVARLEHLEALCAIDHEVIGNSSRSDEIQQAIEEKRCLLHHFADDITGFLIFTQDFFGYDFISLVMVKPSERRKGIASALINAYVKTSTTLKVFSSTNQSNKTMQNVFQTLGFVKSGVIENLDDGDPEIIYVKIASPQ